LSVKLGRLALHIKSEIEIITAVLAKAGLLRDSNSPVIKASYISTSVSWQSNPHLSYCFGSYGRIAHYCELLNKRDYNLLFVDGSIVQFFYYLEKDRVTKHMLCYYPCPYDFSPEEIEELGISDLPDIIGGDELLGRIKLVSPIRFDFDLKPRPKDHPFSHLSAIKDTCRIPAFGPISVGHFVRFVIRYFYAERFQEIVSRYEMKPIVYERLMDKENVHEFYIENMP
jgi:hypothetical protein